MICFEIRCCRCTRCSYEYFAMKGVVGYSWSYFKIANNFMFEEIRKLLGTGMNSSRLLGTIAVSFEMYEKRPIVEIVSVIVGE